MACRFSFLAVFALISTSAYGYDIRFKEHLQLDLPLRLSPGARAVSIVFHTERRTVPIEGSTLHLFVRHSPVLDSSRSFLWVTLNYGLLRSLRLETHNESSTEIVIPIGPDLLKHTNELVLSAQLFPLPGQDSSQLWTEITDRSYLQIVTKEQAPSLDLRDLPFPLIETNSYRDQILDVLVSERASTGTLEATAVIVANFVNRGLPGRPLVRTVRSLSASRNPLLIVGTRQEQPELRTLQSKLSRRDTASLIIRNNPGQVPVLVVTGETPADVLSTANRLFQKPKVLERTWRGFVPPENHFALRDLGVTELRIRPGNPSAALIRLNATPDTRFLDYGIQAEITMDLGESEISPDAYIEAFLNERSTGRFRVLEKLSGSQLSLRINAPGRVLKNQNTLRIVWVNGDNNSARGGEGWILSSSEFYLPRSYAVALPDLALLGHHLFPFSLKADLSDTFVVIPNAISAEILAGLVELAANMGRLSPSDRPAFGVRRTGELTPAIKSNAHLIVLDTALAGKETIVSGLEKPRGDQSLAKHPVIQQIVSPWNSKKYVLRIAANRSGELQEVIRTLFSDDMLERLEGDTVYLTPSRPVPFRFARRQTVGEHFYLTHLEAWMRLNWGALPVILTVVSGLLFLAVRLALNHHKANQ